MTDILLFGYSAISALLFLIGLLSAPRPASVLLIATATLLWPLTMGVIVLHAYFFDPRLGRSPNGELPSDTASARTGLHAGLSVSESGRAASVLRASS